MPEFSGSERRRYRRLSTPLDGSWRGLSGGTHCRIADISWGGCYVHSLAAPASSEPTTVTVILDGRPIEFSGRVVYPEQPIGFAVEFDPLNEVQVAALRPLLGEPPPEVVAAADAGPGAGSESGPGDE